MSVPLHPSSDCAIDLLPDATHPQRDAFYSISVPERVAMDKYVTNLFKGRNNPSVLIRVFLFLQKHFFNKEDMYGAFSNSKPWITPDIKALLKEKKRAFVSGNKGGAEVCAEGAEEDDQEGEEQLQEEDGAPAAAEQHLWCLEGT
ncbi:hypothetical protein L3Q82_004276 [Scortum barcoo]|uniref:Uncharacterized protein n=1 Tax=Scortum barcoo TaxID=214431 RepID=A0ACB8VJI9_9TELE|nr:hypothetical protein L3Q82_004276 [Scortum barcoo]